MSQFVDYDAGELIPLGNTVAQMKATFDTALTTRGFQIVRKRDVPTAWIGNMTNLTNAFNGDHDTDATSQSVSAPWILGFQAPQPFTPTTMRIHAAPSVRPASPADFTLQYSDNGTDWTTLLTRTAEPQYYPNESRVYALSGSSAHTHWRLNITGKSSGSTMGIIGLVLEDSSGFSYATTMGSDIIPVASESIGNSTAREFIRINFSGSTISFLPLMELLTALPMVLRFSGGAAGATTLGITLGGTTVSYTGSAGDSATKNTRKLYEACRDSTNANFMGMTWHFTEGEIFAYQTTPTGNIVASSSNITTGVLSYYAAPGAQSNAFNVAQTLPVDLTSGFLYFIQYNTRGLAWGHKLNSGYYGPVHMGWGDHLAAVGVIPSHALPMAPPMTPIEAYVGVNGSLAGDPDGSAVLTHAWGVADYTPATPIDLNYSGNANYGTFGHPFSTHTQKKALHDAAAGKSPGAFGVRTVLAKGAGIFGADASATDSSGALWFVHRLSILPGWDRYAINGYNYGTVVSPSVRDIDWYRYCGTLTNEQVVASPIPDIFATVSSACGDLDNVISVDSTTGFASSGFIYIDGEVISYSSKSPGSFNGCSRGQKTSIAMRHFVGDKVYPVGFFIKINNGLIFCGYEEPV